MKVLRKSLVWVVAAGSLVTCSTPVNASWQGASLEIKEKDATSSVPVSDLDYIKSSFESLKIPMNKRNSLLRKFYSGVAFDSELGIDPSTSEEMPNLNGSITVINRWPDGSASKTVIFPNGGLSAVSPFAVTLMSVSDCTTTSVVGMIYKRGCQVWHQAVTWSAGFTASFRYSMSNGHYIESISNAITGGIGMDRGELSYIKRSASSSQTAVAQLKARQTINIMGIPTSRDVGIRLNVNWSGGSTTSFGS